MMRSARTLLARRSRAARRDLALRRLGAGACAGALATLPMTAVMLVAQRVGAMGRMPPAKITEAGLDAAGAESTPGPLKRAATAALHVGFGAAAGALYAWWSGRGPGRRGIPQGAAFGTLVWAVSYAGWVPALGIMAPPQRDRQGRPTSMLLAHWVYGGVLGAQVARAR
jgi:hypothetical protein